LHQSGAVLQSITNLLPFTGYPATSTSFSVVPKANTRRAHGSKTEFKENGREKPVSDKNTTKIEFEVRHSNGLDMDISNIKLSKFKLYP